MPKLLSQEQIEQYQNLGYISPLNGLSAPGVQTVRKTMEALEHERGPIFSENRPRPGDPFQGSYRFKSHLLFKWLADVVRTPQILDTVEDLIGPDILCWTTHWFIKEANSPSYVSWHQDSNYWGLDTDQLVSVWLAFSRSSIESGCIRLLPGSHVGPAMTHVDTYHEHNMLTRGQTIEGVDESRAVNLELEPGQVAIFDYRLAHASYPNCSDDRRIGIGIRYIPPTARQVVSDWDSASLVRGTDQFGHFELEPEPESDFDPQAVAMHAKADQAQRRIYYAGAEAAG